MRPSWLLIAILVVAVVRLLPLPPNFSPIAALALFAGAQFESRRWGLLAPLLALLLSDMFLGFHDLMWATYLGFFLISGLAIWLRDSLKQSWLLRLSSAVAGTAIFFVVSNFGVWLQSGLYEASVSGLISCYLAAIPFLDNSLMGDVFFVVILFSAWELAEKRVPGLSRRAVGVEGYGK